MILIFQPEIFQVCAIKDLVPIRLKSSTGYQRKEHVWDCHGFHEFDTQTAGLQPSDLIVIAAHPSMGKVLL
jgi:hypothetical protein